jgi:hypothetical protein
LSDKYRDIIGDPLAVAGKLEKIFVILKLANR